MFTFEEAHTRTRHTKKVIIKNIHKKTNTACEDVGYICRDTGKCIPPQWKCDNWTDCMNEDDEKYCLKCKEGEFTCNDGECIEGKRQCDYVKDCYNGEDELNCTGLAALLLLLLTTTPPPPPFFFLFFS